MTHCIPIIGNIRSALLYYIVAFPSIMSDDFLPFSTSLGGEAVGYNESASKSSKNIDQSAISFSSSTTTVSSSSLASDERRDIPWLPTDFNIKNTKNSPFIRLHNEIMLFCEHIYPPSKELRTREKVTQQLEDLVHTIWPSATFHVFGSQHTRILTSSSDIDIAVLSVPTRDNDPSSKVTLLECLYTLANKLKDNRLVSYVEVIGNAKVPIVKLDHIDSGLSIDICINNDSGLQTGAFVKEAIQKFPPLRPLTIVMKIFLIQRGLHEVYSGGLGSFALTCIIMSFLQMRHKFFTAHQLTDTSNLGVLLLEFFRLYGGSFNLYHTGISLADGGSYFRKRERGGDWFNPKRPNLLCIQNPFYPDQDIGRNSFQITKIRRSFETASQVLECVLADPENMSYLSFILRKEHPSVTVNGNWTGSVTTSLKDSSFVLETKNIYSSIGNTSSGSSSSSGKLVPRKDNSTSKATSDQLDKSAIKLAILAVTKSANVHAGSSANATQSVSIKSPRKTIASLDDIFEPKNSVDGDSSSSSEVADGSNDVTEEELFHKGFTRNKFAASLPESQTSSSKKKKGNKKRRRDKSGGSSEDV